MMLFHNLYKEQGHPWGILANPTGLHRNYYDTARVIIRYETASQSDVRGWLREQIQKDRELWEAAGFPSNFLEICDYPDITGDGAYGKIEYKTKTKSWYGQRNHRYPIGIYDAEDHKQLSPFDKEVFKFGSRHKARVFVERAMMYYNTETNKGGLKLIPRAMEIKRKTWKHGEGGSLGSMYEEQENTDPDVARATSLGIIAKYGIDPHSNKPF